MNYEDKEAIRYFLPGKQMKWKQFMNQTRLLRRGTLPGLRQQSSIVSK